MDIVNGRLDAIDAQTLTVPPLPAVADALPVGTDTMPAIATFPATSDLWGWEEKEGEYNPSPKLHGFLSKRVGDEQLVQRVYSIDSWPNHYANVTVASFKSAEGAAESMPHGGSYDHSAQKDLTGYGWRATAAKGKHGIEVMCAAHDNPVSDECETITVRLMDETLSRLND
jgi:hypothetical protein